MISQDKFLPNQLAAAPALTHRTQALVINAWGFFAGLELSRHAPDSYLIWPLGISSFTLSRPRYLTADLLCSALFLALRLKRKELLLELIDRFTPELAGVKTVALKIVDYSFSDTPTAGELFATAYLSALTCEALLRGGVNLLEKGLNSGKFAKAQIDQYNIS